MSYVYLHCNLFLFISLCRVKLPSSIIFLLSEELLLMCHVDALVAHSPRFFSFWKKSLHFWKLLFFLNIDFWHYRFFVFCFFLFQAFKKGHSIVFCFIVSNGKFAILFIFIPLYTMCFSPLTTFSIFPLSLLFIHFTVMYLVVCRGTLFLFYCVLVILGSLYLCLRFSESLRFAVWWLSLFLENFQPLSLQIFLFSILFLQLHIIVNQLVPLFTPPCLPPFVLIFFLSYHSLNNFCWSMFKFTDSLLNCVKSVDETSKGIFHLEYRGGGCWFFFF